LGELKQTLSGSGSFLFGDKITIADVLVFTALVRCDPVHVPLFVIAGKRLSDFPALTALVRHVYDIPEIAGTVRFDHILLRGCRGQLSWEPFDWYPRMRFAHIISLPNQTC
jgi:putative glutathione S-transferase